MPFGKWNSFGECQTEMMGAPNNYDEETAKKVCGKLQARLEGKEVFKILKSKSGRRILAQYVHVEGLDKEGDVIPLTRTKEALEDLKTRDPRTHNVMWRHSSYQIGWPLWAFTDEDGNLHKTEVDEYGLWGITEIRNDGYQKADEVWNNILRGEKMGASVGITSPMGKMVPLILTKDEIAKRNLRKDWLGARYWDIPLQFIEPWSLTQTPANQYVTNVTVLQKEFCEPCVEARAKWYLDKGLEKTFPEALAHAREFYVKYSQGEPKSDEERAKTHFIISDEDWNKLSGEQKQAYIDKLPERGQKVEKAMTWEECISEARKNPNVTDPEKLCGWLKAHGPNAKSQLAKSMKDVGEELIHKYFSH